VRLAYPGYNIKNERGSSFRWNDGMGCPVWAGLSPSPFGRGVGVRGNEGEAANDHCKTALRCCLFHLGRTRLPRVRFAYPGYNIKNERASSFRWNDGMSGMGGA